MKNIMLFIYRALAITLLSFFTVIGNSCHLVVRDNKKKLKQDKLLLYDVQILNEHLSVSIHL